MSTMLDDLTIDETVLDDVLKCCRCDAGADVWAASRCCNRGDYGCTAHWQKWREAVELKFMFHGSMICRHCRSRFTTFDDAFKVIPI